MAEIKLVPAAGFHLATNYNIKLYLDAPKGSLVPKSYFEAGGRKEAKGDAAVLTEQELQFKVKVVVASEGSFDILGVLKFGICEAETCRPKTQPLTITATGK